MVIVQNLSKVLPDPYFAGPGVYLGRFEVDVGTFDRNPSQPIAHEVSYGNGDGGTAVLAYAPPAPTSTLEPRLGGQDVYEVRVYDSKRNRCLVAAMAIISPSNKDRPEHRSEFVSKVSKLLYQNVSVSIIDIVTTSNFSLYEELLTMFEVANAPEVQNLPTLYVVTVRLRQDDKKRLLDSWHYPLILGQPLPSLPIWLSEKLAVALELEMIYEETCQALRIA